MIENILLFVRNCVMAVLTAWAGIQIAENVQSKPAEATPVVATATAAPMSTSDDGSNCPKRAHPNGETPSSAAAAGPERPAPGTQSPGVLTIR